MSGEGRCIAFRTRSGITDGPGIARYERIVDFDWQIGFDYWEETSDYWKRVRNIINNKVDNSSTFKLKPPQNSEPLWSKLFMMADQHINGEIIKDVTDDKAEKILKDNLLS